MTALRQTPFWVSIPAGEGRKRVYFSDGTALRAYLHRVAELDPDGAALKAVRLPKDLPGRAALTAWTKRAAAQAKFAQGEAAAAGGGNTALRQFLAALGLVIMGILIGKAARRA